MTAQRAWRSVAEVARANAEAGHHFFGPSALRFFGSRIGRTVYGGRYFTTSEARPPFGDDPGGERLWTVRRANGDGTVGTVGAFQAYGTRRAAVAAAMRAAAEEVGA